MSLDWRPPHQHTKHWNKSLQRRLVIFRVLTGEDLRGVPGGHGYSRSAREPQPAGDRCGRTPSNVDTVESRSNGPQLSMRHDDDDDSGQVVHTLLPSPKQYRSNLVPAKVRWCCAAGKVTSLALHRPCTSYSVVYLSTVSTANVKEITTPHTPDWTMATLPLFSRPGKNPKNELL